MTNDSASHALRLPYHLRSSLYAQPSYRGINLFS